MMIRKAVPLVRRGSRKQQQQQQQNENNNNNNGNRHAQEPPVKKPSAEEIALTAKNYRLAKELSEVRVRHREECKNVTRLTMENMNLASRCREAISQVATLKKELAHMHRKAAEARVANRYQQQQQQSSTQRSRLYDVDEGMIKPSSSSSDMIKTLTTNKSEDERSKADFVITMPKSIDLLNEPIDSDDFEADEVVDDPNDTVAAIKGLVDDDDDEDDEGNDNVNNDNVSLTPSQTYLTSKSPRHGNYNEEFPSDISVVRVPRPASTVVKVDKHVFDADENDASFEAFDMHPPQSNGGVFAAMSKREDKSTLSSIDAFEASFDTSFPDSFSPREDSNDYNRDSYTANNDNNGEDTNDITDDNDEKQSAIMDNFNPFFSPTRLYPDTEDNNNDAPTSADGKEHMFNTQASSTSSTTALAVPSSRFVTPSPDSSTDGQSKPSTWIGASIRDRAAMAALNHRRAIADPPGRDRTSPASSPRSREMHQRSLLEKPVEKSIGKPTTRSIVRSVSNGHKYNSEKNKGDNSNGDLSNARPDRSFNDSPTRRLFRSVSTKNKDTAAAASAISSESLPAVVGITKPLDPQCTGTLSSAYTSIHNIMPGPLSSLNGSRSFSDTHARVTIVQDESISMTDRLPHFTVFDIPSSNSIVRSEQRKPIDASATPSTKLNGLQDDGLGSNSGHSDRQLERAASSGSNASAGPNSKSPHHDDDPDLSPPKSRSQSTGTFQKETLTEERYEQNLNELKRLAGLDAARLRYEKALGQPNSPDNFDSIISTSSVDPDGSTSSSPSVKDLVAVYGSPRLSPSRAVKDALQYPTLVRDEEINNNDDDGDIPMHTSLNKSDDSITAPSLAAETMLEKATEIVASKSADSIVPPPQSSPSRLHSIAGRARIRPWESDVSAAAHTLSPTSAGKSWRYNQSVQ